MTPESQISQPHIELNTKGFSALRYSLWEQGLKLPVSEITPIALKDCNMLGRIIKGRPAQICSFQSSLHSL